MTHGQALDSFALDARDEKLLRKQLLMLDWRRVRQFLYVYERRSIGQAAGELNVTQPALSKSLRSLEADLEVRLFERTPLGVVPTSFGEMLAQHAKAIQAELRHALTQLQAMRGASKGHVDVGSGQGASFALMPQATLRLHRSAPGVTLAVREASVDELVPAVRRGELDLAIAIGSGTGGGGGPDPDLTYETFYRERIGVFAGVSHPLAQGEPSAEALAGCDWALPQQPVVWRRQLTEFFARAGLPPVTPTVESNSAIYLRSLVASGAYLSFLPHGMFVPDIASGLVTQLAEADFTMEAEISMVYRTRSVRSPAAAALMAELRGIASPHEEPGET